MQKKYSPEDVIEHLQRVSMLKIGEEWKISEIPKKSGKITASFLILYLGRVFNHLNTSFFALH